MQGQVFVNIIMITTNGHFELLKKLSITHKNPFELKTFRDFSSAILAYFSTTFPLILLV